MEHPHGRVAHIETSDPAAFWALYRKRFPVAGVPVAPALVLPPSLQRELGILNSAATFKLQKDPEQRCDRQQPGVYEPEAQFVTY